MDTKRNASPPTRILLSCYVPLTVCFLLQTALAVFLLVSILDELYIGRLTYLVLVSVALVLTVISCIFTTIIYNRHLSFLIHAEGITTSGATSEEDATAAAAATASSSVLGRFAFFGMSYYATSVMLGLVELFLVFFFKMKSSSVRTLDSSTFVDADNFTSILVYRSIIVLSMCFWAIRLSGFVQILGEDMYASISSLSGSSGTRRRRTKRK